MKPENHISEKRKKLYELRRNAAGCLSKYNRIYHCGCTPQTKSGIDVVKQFDGRFQFQGIQSCGNVWLCPVCAIKIASKRREEVQRLMVYFIEEEYASVGFLTLTVSHKASDKFKTVKNRILGTWRKIQQSREYRELCREYRHLGDIRSLEIKLNKKNGWHPHLHIAVFANCSSKDLQRFGNNLIQLWLNRNMGKAGKIGQSFTHIYNSKGISDYITKLNPLDSKWNAAHELTMSHLKTSNEVEYETYTPWDLLNDINDPWKRKKFQAYAHQIKGTRQLTFSKEVRKAHKYLNGDISDGEVVNIKTDGELVMKIDKDLWREITYNSIQAQVLNKIQFDSVKGLILYLLAHDIISQYDEEKKRLFKIGNMGAFYIKAPPTPSDSEKLAFERREEFLKIVKKEERDYARVNGLYVSTPRRDIDGRIVNPGRPLMKYRLHGEPKWQKASNEWLSKND